MFVLQLLTVNTLLLLSFWLLLPDAPVRFVIALLLIVALFVSVYQRANRIHGKLRSLLEAGFRGLHDGDFSISLPYTENQKDKALIDLFNHMTDKLRVEKQSLYQRELLLDKVVNASDVVTVLVNHRNQIVFANIAAQHFFLSRELVGSEWNNLIEDKKPQLLPHLQKNNAIFQLSQGEFQQSWHLSSHSLKMHGARHHLMLLKPMTKELNDQELKTWKKVIRVINHELNNSIAPISSMCHSGQILAEQLQQPQLDRVFNTIGNRIQKLSEFIQNYSRLARLASPKKQAMNLANTISQLQAMYPLSVECDSENIALNADASQLEQLLINLIKNAQEVSPDVPSELIISGSNDRIEIKLRDFGPGMPQEVMQKAFLPYYTTKQNGSGIGLSICKEVVDAHNGDIELSNHAGGGLEVKVSLPRN